MSASSYCCRYIFDANYITYKIYDTGSFFFIILRTNYKIWKFQFIMSSSEDYTLCKN